MVRFSKGGQAAYHVRYFIFIYLLLFSHEAVAYSRIISLKPSATDMVFALGFGDKLVGVTAYCKHPREEEKRLESIEKVGGYSNPNLEKIISLKPDLVVLIPDSTSPRVYEALNRAHIETLVLQGKTLDDIFSDLNILGQKLGVSEKAKELSEKIKNEISSLKKNQTTHTAYIVVQRQPLMVAGSNTFLSELLKLAGFKNLGDESILPYPRLSLETFLKNQPDVIFDIDAAPIEKGENYWGRFPSLPAVRNHKIIHLPADLFIPDTQVAETLRELLKYNSVVFK